MHKTHPFDLNWIEQKKVLSTHINMGGRAVFVAARTVVNANKPLLIKTPPQNNENQTNDPTYKL